MATQAAAVFGAGVTPELLRSAPLFREFDDDQLADVARLIAVHRYRRHATIVREGEPGNAFFLIVTGSVAVVREVPEGKERILSVLKPTDFFGEMSLFEEAHRSASVRALTVADIGVIHRDDFLKLLDRKPRICRALVTALGERLRTANAQIAAATSQDIRSRLAALLLHLSANFGEPTATGTRISLHLTNQEMANMIGSSRETVNRTLNKFRDDRLIDRKATNVTLCAPEKLRALVHDGGTSR